MREDSRRVPFAISTGVSVLVNLIGNSMICAVILRNKFMRTPVNYLLLNLAVADIMIGVCALPVRTLGSMYAHPGGKLGYWLCKLVTGDHVLYIDVTVSAFTLSAIAYERYQAVVHPFRAKEKVTNRKVFIFVAVNWFVALCIVSFFCFVYHFDNTVDYCAVGAQFNNENAIYTMCYGSVAFGIPFVSMIYLYGRVVRELIKKQHFFVSREQLAALNRFKKKITFMLVTVTIIFAATWGVGAVIVLADRDYTPGGLIATTCTLLVCINSSTNCFLYTLFSNQFRRGLKNIFYRKKQRQINSTSNKKEQGNSCTDEQALVIETKL